MNSTAFWNGGRLFQEGEIRSCLCIAGSVADSACMNAGSLQLPEPIFTLGGDTFFEILDVG